MVETVVVDVYMGQRGRLVIVIVELATAGRGERGKRRGGRGGV